MKAIMVMFDSLRRDLLPPSGDSALNLPNFKRLAQHTVAFDNSYCCSLPCMPARRELHTGRPNFLHRSWGPLEPFDDSMPEILHKNGIHSHLATDHYHYLEDGGCTYQGRYSSWACYRGQEADQWVGDCEKHEGFSPIQLNPQFQPEPLRTMRLADGWQNMANRTRYADEDRFPQMQTFDDGLDFIQRNSAYDNWFVQIETFDPHEPFCSPSSYQQKWMGDAYDELPDWPSYGKVREDEETVENIRKKYYSLMEFCDRNLGRVLDAMDASNLWEDTLLIVNTDHGFLLGEHGWWGKGRAPDYNEIIHTPLFIWDPSNKARDELRSALVQTIDLAPTILSHFNLPIPEDMLGKPLQAVIREEKPVRESGIIGYHGGPITITDGRYLYMRNIRNTEALVEEYTLMPTHLRGLFSLKEIQSAELVQPFGFTKGCPVLRMQSKTIRSGKLDKDYLFDLQEDPDQLSPIDNPETEQQLLVKLAQHLKQNEAPAALYKRFGIEDLA